MKTTKFYYVCDLDVVTYFRSLRDATKHAREMIRAMKAYGNDSGFVTIMQMDVEWPMPKDTMLRVLNGHGYAEKVFEVSRIEW